MPFRTLFFSFDWYFFDLEYRFQLASIKSHLLSRSRFFSIDTFSPSSITPFLTLFWKFKNSMIWKMNLESMSIDRWNVFIVRIISEFTRLKRTQRRFGSIHRQSKTLHFNSDKHLLEFWKWAIFPEWNDVFVEFFSRIFLKPLWSVDGAAFKKCGVCQKGQILFYHE